MLYFYTVKAGCTVKDVGRVFLRISLCSLKVAAALAGVWIIFDLLFGGTLWTLISLRLWPPRYAGMQGPFEALYVILSLLAVGLIGMIIGSVWAVWSAKETAGCKTIAGVMWLSLLALVPAFFGTSLTKQPEIYAAWDQLDEVKAEELIGGKLRFTGRLKDGGWSVTEIETDEYQDPDGFPEMSVCVLLEFVEGGGGTKEFNYTLELPEGTERVVLGGNNGQVLWGRTPEESLEEYEKKLHYSNLVALWKEEGETEGGTDAEAFGWLAESIRTDWLTNEDWNSAGLGEVKKELSKDDDFYKDRITGKIKAFKASYHDGSFIIFDKEDEENPNPTGAINIIIGGADGTMTLLEFPRHRFYFDIHI